MSRCRALKVPTSLGTVTPLAHPRRLVRRLVRRIRLHWPQTVMTSAAKALLHMGSLRDPIRGEGHDDRREAMARCEQYVLSLFKNAILNTLVYAKADEVRTKRAIEQIDIVRDYQWLPFARVCKDNEVSHRGPG